MPSQEDTLYAEIGLQQDLFSEAELGQARQQVKKGGTVGEVLLSQGVVSRGQHKGLVRAVAYRLGRDADKRIAQILVDHGYCASRAVKHALKAQKALYAKSGQLVRLGNLLVDEGVISDSQHTAATKLHQLGLES